MDFLIAAKCVLKPVGTIRTLVISCKNIGFMIFWVFGSTDYILTCYTSPTSSEIMYPCAPNTENIVISVAFLVVMI